MMGIIDGMMGIVLLVLGRRLFWLFVGCMGFVAGLQAAQLYFGLQPFWVVWAVALLFGVIGALLALFFQKLAIGLGGFAAGSIISTHLMILMGLPAAPIITVLGGIIGAILLYVLFDWALIVLSSLAGAAFLVQAVGLNPQAGMVFYLALIGAGIVFQTVLWRRQKPKTK